MSTSTMTATCKACRREIPPGTGICPHCNTEQFAWPSGTVPGAAAGSAVAIANKGVGGGTITLLVLSVGAAMVGFTMLSEATVGVGIIAIGCWFAILARISQAGDHLR